MPSSRTKQLAKRLGLIKRGSELVTSRVNGVSKRRKVQIFSHIIVLDFEATCWKGKKTGKQEIIEFPCVLIDVSAGKITDEFQQYVQPQERPVLSSFCTELTGIVQEQVDGGVPLPTCVMLFNKWLHKVEEERGFNMAIPGQDYTDNNDNLCVIATWTDWDLEVCLKYECQRKRIKKPICFNHWIDLRATYKSFYNRKPAGLNGALKDLGIEFEGREHCGLHDARNTAKLCIRLIDDGCQLNITKSTHETTNTRSCQLPQPVLTLPINKDRTPLLRINNEPKGGISAEEWLSVSIPNNNGICTRIVTPPSPVTAPPITPLTSVTTPPTSVTTPLTSVTTLPTSVTTPLTSVTTPLTINVTKCATTSRQSTDSTPSLYTSNINELSIKGHCGQQTLHSIISPFITKTNFSNRQTSTPIIAIKTSNDLIISAVTSNSSSSLFKTPSIISNYSGSRELITTPRILSMTSCSLTGKVTPPLCKCGKRTKRKLVSTEGPNEGKPFYCCCMKRQSGCGYFEWESSVLKKYSEYTPELLTSEYYD